MRKKDRKRKLWLILCMPLAAYLADYVVWVCLRARVNAALLFYLQLDMLLINSLQFCAVVLHGNTKLTVDNARHEWKVNTLMSCSSMLCHAQRNASISRFSWSTLIELANGWPIDRFRRHNGMRENINESIRMAEFDKSISSTPLSRPTHWANENMTAYELHSYLSMLAMLSIHRISLSDDRFRWAWIKDRKKLNIIRLYSFVGWNQFHSLRMCQMGRSRGQFVFSRLISVSAGARKWVQGCRAMRNK